MHLIIILFSKRANHKSDSILRIIYGELNSTNRTPCLKNSPAISKLTEILLVPGQLQCPPHLGDARPRRRRQIAANKTRSRPILHRWCEYTALSHIFLITTQVNGKSFLKITCQTLVPSRQNHKLNFSSQLLPDLLVNWRVGMTTAIFSEYRCPFGFSRVAIRPPCIWSHRDKRAPRPQFSERFYKRRAKRSA